MAGDGELSVSCPKAYSEEANYSGYRAIFEKRSGKWYLAAFLSGR